MIWGPEIDFPSSLMKEDLVLANELCKLDHAHLDGDLNWWCVSELVEESLIELYELHSLVSTLGILFYVPLLVTLSSHDWNTAFGSQEVVWITGAVRLMGIVRG